MSSRIMKEFVGIASSWSNLRIEVAFKISEIRTSDNLFLSA